MAPEGVAEKIDDHTIGVVVIMQHAIPAVVKGLRSPNEGGLNRAQCFFI